MNTTLSQIRGDTKRYKFQRINSDGSVITTPPDKIYFTVKKNYDSKEVLIQKTLEDITIDEQNVYHFTIEPADTDSLRYGNYVFDIEVITDDVKTTIAKGGFGIEQEVTFVADED